MERWAANTLRGLGILVTAVVMIAVCLVLLLLSMCAWKSPNNGQAVGFLISAVFVLAIGIFIIARLTRGLMRDTGRPSSEAKPPESGTPLHISPASAEALDQLSYTIGAAIGLGVLFWGMTLYRLSTTHFAAPEGAFSSIQKPWLIVSLIAEAIHLLPYVLVLFRLQQKPDRPALAFSMAIPTAAILHSATTLPLYFRMLSSPHLFGQTLLPMAAALALEIVIVVLAWRANQRLGYRQEPMSLIVAAGAVYVYFIIFGSGNAWMYRLIH